MDHFQAFVNIGVVTSVLPVIVPFISAGEIALIITGGNGYCYRPVAQAGRSGRDKKRREDQRV